MPQADPVPLALPVPLPGPVDWAWLRYASLALDDLYDLLALRSAVFSVEQNCAYLDPDGVDRQCWHLLGRGAQGQLMAYLRGVDPGAKYAEASIGRVITAPVARGTGLGRQLVAEGLRRMDTTWPGVALRISAQAHLDRFYAGFGFAAVGGQYMEDNIPHIEMLRPAP